MLKKILALLLTLLLCPSALAQETERTLLQVHQMMIGFADGYLIRLGDIDILVDGGEANPKKPEGLAIDYLRAAGVDKLDAYILTHWHLDHCMNMNTIMAEFGDENTLVYGVSDQPPAEIFNGSVTAPIGPVVNGEYRRMAQGDVLTFGGMTITCIGPEKLSQNGGCNQDSLNFLLRYGERRFLFTGDLAQSGPITGAYAEVCANVDVLKFPHHGAQPYEIGQKASRTVRPQVLLVPGVTSKYKLWDFFDDLGVKFPQKNVLTNADGHVVILTDGGDRFDILTQQDPADYAPKTE